MGKPTETSGSNSKLRHATRNDKECIDNSASASPSSSEYEKVNKEVSKKMTVSYRLILFLQNQTSKNILRLRKYKLIANALDRFDRMPPRMRRLVLFFVIIFKILWAIFTMYLVCHGASKFAKKKTIVEPMRTTNLMDVQRQLPMNIQNKTQPFRILHIVTSLAQYNSGKRATVKGQDRLVDIMIPAIKSAVNSIKKQPNWSVDVYLILGFDMSPARRSLVEKVLPAGVGLEVWNDATPYGYDEITANSKKEDPKVVRAVTRGLARQHRYLIKDKLEHYDFFTSFEDDMRITASHIEAFMDMTQKIDLIKETSEQGSVKKKISDSIDGPMTLTQLERVIPGFFRVEVLQDGAVPQNKIDPIPVDLAFDDVDQTVNPNYCCAVPESEQASATKILLPPNPQPKDLITWETTIGSFSVRKFPDPIGWTGLLPGTKGLAPGEVIPSYWSGTNGSLGHRSRPADGALFGQQGGFMANRNQIKTMNKLCPGGFLPPFNKPAFYEEGLENINVETWSGGFQLFAGGIRGCNFQRIIPLDPDEFSKFLLYHSANNKQKQIARNRKLRAETLLGQLNYVKKEAESTLEKYHVHM